MRHNSIEDLIYLFSKLPGMGKRSARRAVFHMLANKQGIMLPLATKIADTAREAVTCSICFNIDVSSPCHICASPKRDRRIVCVVETIADLWAIERSNMFFGCYHVLSGALSAALRKNPEDLRLVELGNRISNSSIEEIIIATNATLDGQTTAFYIIDFFKDTEVKISRLASGMPIGGELDYLDEGTLNAAFSLRQIV